jgi:hypothetical protein
VGDGAVVIRGSASCFYLKQLALQAALDVVGADGGERITSDLQVPERPRCNVPTPSGSSIFD